MINDTKNNYRILLGVIEISDISAEDLLNIFMNWYGLQLLNDDFIKFLKDEHIIY